MPQSFNYSPILALASPARMAAYKYTFAPANDSELYGAYIWAQHVVGALYPLTQHAEIALRNSIDNEATARFGSFWWTKAPFNGAGSQRFQGNILKAMNKLLWDWEKEERKRLGLSRNAPVPTPVPVWTHDQIIGATEFSTWEFILNNAFAQPSGLNSAVHLWPAAMSSCFRTYHLLDPDQKKARKKLADIIREIRDYRNRLFHHDKIWTGQIAHSNVHNVITSIRHKINQMELMLNVIDVRLVSILKKTGVLPNARRVCSMNDLDIYRFAHSEQPVTRRKKRVLRSITGRARQQNVTQAWTYAGSLFGVYQIR